ncbi:hypothetical protein [Tessaracoccus palaemonis]|uniref:Uncharacterized protein n=1 Tax=Tessaracoccus palaemonis TaxID=2829499 RepID=A0ABX8SDY8_9ACTN|nr:hypothetical protein [Tessaracoccus palaemonis]QXT61617.1 hypothetical protein KDB89_07265 [Tessaracoccus palaemonis]
MPRPLTSEERLVLVSMIDRAEPFDGEARTNAAARHAWRAQVAGLVVDSMCGCGVCPSVSLSSTAQPAVGSGDERVILGAGLSDALVLLLIDDGTPSYLELAPRSDGTSYTVFPDATLLEF